MHGPPLLLAAAVFSLTAAAALAASALGDALILGIFNAIVNTASIGILTYVTQITRALDRKEDHGGK